MKASFLIIMAAILTSNTFSSQYMIWAAPFVPFLKQKQAGLYIFCTFLTWFYFGYWEDIIKLQPMATGLLIMRNTLLITIFIWVLLDVILVKISGKRKII